MDDKVELDIHNIIGELYLRIKTLEAVIEQRDQKIKCLSTGKSSDASETTPT
jgi:hypothetical protein